MMIRCLFLGMLVAALLGALLALPAQAQQN